jgi:hypothetical protein
MNVVSPNRLLSRKARIALWLFGIWFFDTAANMTFEQSSAIRYLRHSQGFELTHGIFYLSCGFGGLVACIFVLVRGNEREKRWIAVPFLLLALFTVAFLIGPG